MAIPDYQSIMLPLLRFAADGNEHSLREAIEGLSEQFGLTDAEKNELLPSGQQPRFDNRVAWSRSYMSKAALLEATRRGHFRITQRGQEVLSKNLSEINVKFLDQFPEFVEFRAKHREREETTETAGTETLQTPGELLETAYQKLREDLTAELLKFVRECSPSFFERLVIDVLVKMDYGGSRKEAGKAIGRSGDELLTASLTKIALASMSFISAKRWQATIGRPEIRNSQEPCKDTARRKGLHHYFRLQPRSRGICVKIDSKIVLIDGEQLAQLMIVCVGCSVTSYETKKIDSDYFIEG